MKAFPFFDLPPEIREKIYLMICHNPAEYVPLHSGLSPQNRSHLGPGDELDLRSIGENGGGPSAESHHAYFPWNLLFVNSQMYHEVRPLYFSHNAFTTSVAHRNQKIDYFLSPTFRDNRRLIKKLRVTIYRFGQNNYFIDQFLPMLEDMILNGSLRELEVQLRWQHLFHESSVEKSGVMVRKFARGQATAELMSIMRDPYLERVRLMTLPDGLASEQNAAVPEDHTDLLKSDMWL